MSFQFGIGLSLRYWGKVQAEARKGTQWDTCRVNALRTAAIALLQVMTDCELCLPAHERQTMKSKGKSNYQRAPQVGCAFLELIEKKKQTK